MSWDFIDDYTGNRYFKYGDITFDMDNLMMDELYFTVTPSIDVPDIFVYTLNKECIECPYEFMFNDQVNKVATNSKLRIATEFKEYFPQNQNDSVICDLDPNFKQFGIYNIKVDRSSCSVDTLKDPVNIYTPIVTALLLHIIVFGAMFVFLKLWGKFKKKSEPQDEPKKIKKERVASLDTFRGISIVIMIFANFGSGGYQFFDHSIWNGLHPADLVFPWFMWIMGVCVPISLTSSFKRGVSNNTIMLNVIKRSIKLFVLGIFLNSGANVYSIRIFGVLQRFSVCYLVMAVICVYTMNRDLTVRDSSILRFVDDVLKIWKGWILVIGIVILHTVLIFCVAEPGCPGGYLGPGGLHKNQSYEKCIGGATGYIDRLILGTHVYQYPTIYEVYEARPFDPEGLVGCLTTILHGFLGVQAGITLLVFKKHSQRILRWLLWSVVLGSIGGALCGFSKEDGLIPVNKNLWSLSFVMVTCCLAFFLLSVYYFLIDAKKLWNGKPMLFAGMNAIILYIGHEMTDGHFPVRWYYYEGDDDNWRRTHFYALLSDLWGAEFWVIVAFCLYKINYFFTI